MKEKKKRKKKKEKERPKFCRFCKGGVKEIDYKEVSVIRRCMSPRGKILPSNTTGTCPKHQRQLAGAIKRARFIGLLPYINR